MIRTYSAPLRQKFIKENPNTVNKFAEVKAKVIEWTRITPHFESIIEKKNRKEETETIQYWKRKNK